MVKASALYIVIVIALVIGVVCASLIATSFYYKIQYQKKARYDQLNNNLASGINILLGTADTAYSAGKTFSLFNNESDSVYLKKANWGIYTIGVAEAFNQRDTLYKTFTIANRIDSAKWACLYLTNNERPFAVSGKTSIRGDAYIPEAGVQAAYLNNNAYQGDKRLIIGTKHNSEKTLPALDTILLQTATRYFQKPPEGDKTLLNKDSLTASFLQPTRILNFGKDAQVLEGKYYAGNVILYSDTTVTIDSTSTLKNALVFARAIIVKSGFRGNCQLFATDSISVGPNAVFTYPSCLGIVRSATKKINTEEKITLGDNSQVFGTIFTYESNKNTLKPLIIVGKKVKVQGQVYSQGIMQLMDQLEIDGSVYTGTFFYRSSFTLYENYVVNTTINSKALSPYYLTSKLLPVAGAKQKVMQWLESN